MQTKESEDDDVLHSEEQHMLLLSDDEEGKCPIEITQSVASDEKHVSFPARKDSAMLPPMEDSTMQNASSESQPNMVGMRPKENAAKSKPRVQKMPSFDRNYETLSAEDLEKFKKQVR